MVEIGVGGGSAKLELKFEKGAREQVKASESFERRERVRVRV